MEKKYLYIPQWQGSGFSNELFHGAKALKDVVERIDDISFINIGIKEYEISDIKNDIIGYDVILGQLMNIQDVLRREAPHKVFSIGGDCGIEVPILSYLQKIHRNMTVFWFDAHGDLNSPQSSPSKSFHGMPLRFLVDDSIFLDSLSIDKLRHSDIVLMGTRDLDPPERDYIEKHSMKNVSVNDIQTGNNIFKEDLRFSDHAYIHIDLDVLDPASYKKVKCPSKNGLTIDQLLYCLESIRKKMSIVGVSLVENTETDKEKIVDLKKIIDFGTTF